METNDASSRSLNEPPPANDAASDVPVRPCAANRAFIERGFRLYYRRMLGTAYNTLGRGHPDAPDIIDDTFLQLLQRADPIVLDKPKEEAVFFCRVVHNLALNRIRYNAVRERDDGTTDQMIRNGLNLQPRGPSRCDLGDPIDVEHIMNLLPDADRDLIRQTCMPGKTPSEVARASRLRECTVSYRLRRAFAAVEALAARLPQPLREGVSNSLLNFRNSTPLNTLDGRKARTTITPTPTRRMKP